MGEDSPPREDCGTGRPAPATGGQDLVQERAHAIYLLGPSPEGKFYVGQTEAIARRMSIHRRADGRCPELHRAILRFGWDAFPASILAQTDMPDEADRLERLHIARHNSLFPHGYNMTTGGRSTLFDPRARVEGFEETPIPEEEIRRTAAAMAGPFAGKRRDGLGCPLCGEPKFWDWGGESCRCQTQPDMALVALRHLAAGGTEESMPLIGDAAALRRWRQCPAADLFMGIERRRLRSARQAAGDPARVKIAEIMPTAACRYVQRLLAYAAEWVRRRALVARGLPCLQPDRFIAVPGGRARLDVGWSVEDSLWRNRAALCDPAERAGLLARQFEFHSKRAKRDWPIVEAALRATGASEAEIAGARDRGLFDYRVRSELPASGIGGDRGIAGVPGMEPSAWVYPEDGPARARCLAATFPDEASRERFLMAMLDLPPEARNAAATRFAQAPPPGITVSDEEPPGPDMPTFSVARHGNDIVIQFGFVAGDNETQEPGGGGRPPDGD